MPDFVIPDLDDATIERLKAAAQRRGVDLKGLVVAMLGFYDGEGDAAVLDEIAAMRASQPQQQGDAARDIRRLRDGGDEAQDVTRAA